jgi:hypothetical protein
VLVALENIDFPLGTIYISAALKDPAVYALVSGVICDLRPKKEFIGTSID